MRKSGIIGAAPVLLIWVGTGGSPVSGAWMVFFALSLKRSGGRIAFAADYTAGMQPGTEFVAF
jgi:hypothetical protein